MSATLIQPDPDPQDAPQEHLADVLNLPVPHTVEEPETASQARWSSAWARIREEITPSPHPADTPAMAWPSLRPYLPTRASLSRIKPGTLIIFRSSWALARLPWTLTITRLRRKNRTTKQEETTDGEGAEKKPTKSKTTKAKGKEKSLSGDTIIGALLLAGMGVTFAVRTALPALGSTLANLTAWVTEHPVAALRGTGLVLIVFLPAAWTVGQCAEKPPSPTPQNATELPEATPENASENTAEKAPLTVLEWVRKAIGNNRAVHLQELLLDAQNQAGGEALTMADLRAGLGAHNIPIRDSVKAPASDHNGAAKNRVGVHRDDLPPDPT
ncbi:hypothetical protein, partial [Streptomyces sp. MBT51]